MEKLKVSICLPNLNTRPFLEERVRSIEDQTLQDFEVVIVDDGSTDGASEFLQNWAARNPKVRYFDGPRQGLYAGWNECIKRCRGEFIYIATSDDTMEPTCIEELARALENNQDCGIAQCKLQLIDEDGSWNPGPHQWENWRLGTYDRRLVDVQNKRLAPHDGLLHPIVLTVFTSFTQILVRRSVYEYVGLFDGRWGPVSDYEWGMRAALLTNVAYIPKALAYWRIHGAQATEQNDNSSLRGKMIDMASVAFEKARAIAPSLSGYNISEYISFLKYEFIEKRLQEAPSLIGKGRVLVEAIVRYRRESCQKIASMLTQRLFGKKLYNDRFARLRQLNRSNGVDDLVVICSEGAA